MADALRISPSVGPFRLPHRSDEGERRPKYVCPRSLLSSVATKLVGEAKSGTPCFTTLAFRVSVERPRAPLIAVSAQVELGVDVVENAGEPRLGRRSRFRWADASHTRLSRLGRQDECSRPRLSSEVSRRRSNRHRRQ